MKADSDNFRQAENFDIMKQIRVEDVKVVIYEPSFKDNRFEGYRVVSGIAEFKAITDGILVTVYKGKVYPRDVYNEN